MRRFFLHIVFFITLIIAFLPSLYSQPDNVPEYKNRRSLNKFALFPISDNQKMYDVKSYDLNFDFNLSDTSFSGVAVITLQSLAALSYIHLDLASKSIFNRTNNRVDSVFISGRKQVYSHTDTTLIINLENNYNSGEIISLKIFYQCKIDNFYLMYSMKNSRRLIFNLSEPFGARFWFPCKDYPEDKADSVRMTITMPEEYYAASNGNLEKTEGHDGKKTYYWAAKYPISTYLISIAAYPYAVYHEEYKSTGGKTFDIINCVIPEDTASFIKVRSSLSKMIGFYEKVFGEYPFSNEKYGHAQINFSGGMENQTITSLGLWNEYLMAHELAHSWYGDAVTCKDFHNIWLNEGFATYLTAMYLEAEKSKTDFMAEMNSRRYFGNGTIYREEMNDDMSIFSEGLVYSKAAWVLHMLRHITGDEKFILILNNYYKNYKYKNAAENDFERECENVTGTDLSWFFHQWIHEEYTPYYKYSWQQVKSGTTYNVTLSIEQLPPASYIFKMPVDITFKSGGWDTTIVAVDSLQFQKFDFTFTKNIDSLFIDKAGWILKKIYTEATGVTQQGDIISYRLSQNYPNPFNSSSNIKYDIVKAGEVTIKLFDLLGREVKTLVKKYHEPGSYLLNIEAGDLATGAYYCLINVNGFQEMKKIMLMK